MPELTEADYDRLVTVLDVLLDRVRGVENHPFRPLLHHVGDLIAAYDQEHHPPENIGLIRVTLDLTLEELDDLLTALADWSPKRSDKVKDDDDVGRPALSDPSAREERIGELYQRFGAFLPDGDFDRSPLWERLRPLIDEVAALPRTGLKADKAFFDSLDGLDDAAERGTAWDRFAKAIEAMKARRSPEEQAALGRFLDDLGNGVGLEEAELRLERRRYLFAPKPDADRR